MARTRTFLPFALVGLALAAPRLASACHPRTICVKWETQITDNGFGEDFVFEEVPGEDKILAPARGAKVQLIPPAPEPPLSTFLDQEGCLTFETQFAHGHKLLVYAEAWVGSPDPVQIRMERQEVFQGAFLTDFFWIVHLHGLVPNDTTEFVIPGEEKDPIVPLMALSTEVMHRFDELDVLPPPPASLRVQFLDWFGNARGGCSLIQVGPDSFREKFIVAHEMGHWLECEWNADATPGTNYGYGMNNMPKAPDPPCRFDVLDPEDLMGNLINTDARSHGIRSAEWSSSAMGEGFAHFIAAVAFNNFLDLDNSANEDGVFRYYKDINTGLLPDYVDFMDPQQGNSRVSLLGGTDSNTLGGVNRWTENMCLGDWQIDEVSTEIDWMRFFWHFLTRAGNPPTLPQILDFLAFVAANPGLYPMDDINVFPQLQQAMGDSLPQFLTRFNAANAAMGVHNGN